MSWPKILGWRGLVAGLAILFMGVLGWMVVYVWHLVPAGALSTVIKILSPICAALGSVNTVLNRAAKLLAPPSESKQLRLLAEESKKRWEAAANERGLRRPVPLPIRWRRSMEPVAGPTSAATASPRFRPLPRLTVVSDSDLCEGDQHDLHRVYGGLPSGRLLLIGKAGSGKSAAAILLLLDALQYREDATREDQAKIPVPVLFTLHGWQSNSGQSVTDWIVGKLAETYPMFRRRAARSQAANLLEADRLAVFLDGLDEIPESVRPDVLRALANARYRLVLLTRIKEAVEAASHSRPLEGAVALELQPVQPTDAAAYLLHPLVDPPPTPWQEISDDLTNTHNHSQPSALAQALTTPLNLSLLRDTYKQNDAVDTLLNEAKFPTSEAIENQLLDRAIETAYTSSDDQRSRYTVQTARRTLRYLATQLDQHGTRDLAWWHISAWTKPYSRITRVILASLLIQVPIATLVLGLLSDRPFIIGFFCAAVLGLIARLIVAFRRKPPPVLRQVRPARRRTLKRVGFVTGVVTGVPVGALFGVLAGIMTSVLFNSVAGVVVGVLFGVVIVVIAVILGRATNGAGVGLTAWFVRSSTEVDANFFGPVDALRRNRNARFVFIFSLVFNLVVTAVFAAVYGVFRDVYGGVFGALGTVFAAEAGIVLGQLGVITSTFMETALVRMQLTIQHKTPLRLIAFLEDARKKHLLRTVGPIYQFRHAKLQNKLAEESQSRHGRTPPSA